MGMVSLAAETQGQVGQHESQKPGKILRHWVKLCLHSGLPLNCQVLLVNFLIVFKTICVELFIIAS